MTNTSPKRLYRSRKNQIIAGVAAGFAQYLNLDPTLVRVLFVLLGFASAGFAVLLYIILAIVIPVEETDKQASLENDLRNAKQNIQDRVQHVANDIKTANEKRATDARLFVALALIVIGLIALSNEILPGFGIRWSHIWPTVLIIFGLLLIIRKD